MAMIQMRPAYNRWFLSQRLNQMLCSTPDARSRKSGRASLIAMLAIIVLLCPFIARAQELAATLSGIVTDSSAAVIPNATITIVLNGVNGIARVVQSDGNGNYVATNLTAGTYSITVAATGFETYKGKNIVLNVAEKHAVNVQLKTGSATTTVTVEDNPVSVDTESSAQSGTISGTQVRELELANRNFEQLVVLQPGVVNALGDNVVGGGSTGLSVNGARTNANNWTVDGADINDSGSNATITNVPSIDAIQEFTLERGSYDAGYGRSGGGQILVATKNGTSTFHGGVYEFDRNTAFNANDYFNKQAQIAAGQPNKPAVYHYNNYGFTIGGPIFIPKVYNSAKTKTFFFWSEEWFKNTQPGNASFAAATAAEISGVVPGHFTNGPAECLSYDAGTNTTTIASSCFSKNSQVYLTNVYDKNPANSGGNYAFSYSAKQDEHQDIVRVDHYFNEKVHFFARGMNDNFPNNQPMGLWAGNNYPGLVNTAVDAPGKNVVGNLTWAISPKIVNEVEFVYAQGTYHSTIQSGQFATSASVNSALTNNWAYTDPYGRVPSIGITGLQGFSPGSAPWKERNLDRTYFDNLAITLGKHTLRTGFQFQQMLKTENAVAGGPSFNFNSWGDFLLGNVRTYSQASRDIIPDLHYINSEAYVQDDWKINKRLTLNLGVRWSSFPSPTDVKNTLNNFDPSLYSASNAPVIDPTTGNFDPTQTALIPATYTNGIIFPKGAACTAAKAISSQVSCSPYGSYVNPNDNTNFGPRIGFAYNPDGRGRTSIRGGFGIFYDRLLNGIWEQNAFADPPLLQTTTVNNTSFDAPSGANAVSYGPNGLTVTGTPTFKVPHYANFNLSVERQLLPTTTIEVAYVGNQARHLLGEFDMNQPTEAARTANPTADVNALRPYLGYGYMHTRAPLFTNNYNSLQVSLQHRSSKGLTVGIAYTWSKDLTTNSNDRGSSASNSYNFRMDYGPSSTNTPQILEANYIYELPFYKQQLGLVGHLLGGWQVSGISSFVSGSSFTVTQNTDPFAAVGPNGLGMIQDGDIGIRPDLVAPIHRTKTAAHWFSTSSFATATGHFGTERIGSLLGPGVQNWDLASIKNVNLGEHLKFQLRGEYFNAFNHTNFSGVDSSMNDANFGQVTSAHVPRRIQIGAKLNF
jgi:hypothetical protein